MKNLALTCLLTFPIIAYATNADEVCFPLFKATGAIPLTQACPLLSSGADVGMATRYCTSSTDEINRYCQNICPIDPLAPITDADATSMENGNNVLIDKLSTSTQTALSCLRTAISELHGSLTVTSAYRPQAYQDHLYEIFEKRKKLKKINKIYPQCQDVSDKIDTENAKHGLKNLVGKISNHPDGNAFDANWSLVTKEQVDVAAKTCELSRPFPVIDPVHFQK